MHEQPQPIPLIEQLQSEDQRLIKIEEVDTRLPELLKRGLKIMFICYEGRGVSRAMAEIVSVQKKVPAMYLRFGLEALAKLDAAQATTVIKHISQVPVIVSYVPFERLREATIRERAVFEELEEAVSKQTHHRFYQTGPLRQTPNLGEILRFVDQLPAQPPSPGAN